MRVSKSLVIETASKIADKQGLNNLSLKAVAEKLNVRTPSLYNHIESLDDLLREVAHKGMRSMNEQMAQAAIGKSGNTALRGISVEYLNFIIEHPGVYETIQWATWHGTNETAQIFENYKLKHQNGLASITELIKKEAEALVAQAEEIEAKAMYLNAKAEYKYAMGLGIKD